MTDYKYSYPEVMDNDIAAQGLALDLNQQHDRVERWFSPPALASLFQPAQDPVVRLACDWLGRGGKRWRPFLTVCVVEILAEVAPPVSEETLHRATVAVECFHKASLIHDDIEDDDTERYGEQTLHCRYGVPIALNIGDYLLAEGYRLLTDNDLDAGRKAPLIGIAAEGHRILCLGQGAELAWTREPDVLGVDDVIAIFRQKTAPAFEVALKIGAMLTNQMANMETILSRYSDALGIAYQIKDDLEDLRDGHIGHERILVRPSILLALAYEQAQALDRAFLQRVWQGQSGSEADLRRVLTLMEQLNIEQQAIQSLESYKDHAINALTQLDNQKLKHLLQQVMNKIFPGN